MSEKPFDADKVTFPPCPNPPTITECHFNGQVFYTVKAVLDDLRKRPELSLCPHIAKFIDAYEKDRK